MRKKKYKKCKTCYYDSEWGCVLLKTSHKCQYVPQKNPIAKRIQPRTLDVGV